ncbi:hypothetical protein [Bradyrhizobium sp. McL0616]|uniref:hypothetical protein n=1 Tax=Bradyrhizobium sp. McL0616 TaxID=3415674 RepID=UPI003CEAE6CC
MNATMTIYSRSGETRVLSAVAAENEVRASRGFWSFSKPLPRGWDRVVPRYCAPADLHPSPLARHRFENPISFSTHSSLWQYCDEPGGISAGETVETTAWPHLTMQPLNHSAIAVRDYLRDHMKSRLPQSPWRAGRLYLDDGLSGAVPHDHLLARRVEPAVPSPIRVAGR